MIMNSLIPLFDRYYWLMADTIKPFPSATHCDKAHLMYLCKDATARIKNGEMPYGKACRWLGFIQGVLCVCGVLTVAEERDFTRPIFRGEGHDETIR